MSKTKKKAEAENVSVPKEDFYHTDDTFEIAFLWARGLQLHHIERSQGNKQRCRAYFIVPPSVNLVQLKREWADEPFSRPYKDVLFRYKQFKDELRRFYANEAAVAQKKTVEEAQKIADEVTSSPELSS